MGGNIKINNQALSRDISPHFQLASGHEGTPRPKFGGEIETMIFDGSMPIAYAGTTGAGTQDIFSEFVSRYGYSVGKSDHEGNPIVLEGPSRTILCLEHFASVVERTDRAFKGNGKGLGGFLGSVDAYAKQLSRITQDLGLTVSPFDYNTLAGYESFLGRESPGRPEQSNPFLRDFDDRNKQVDSEIECRAVSSHFSVGFRDQHHLKRMMAVLMYLTPGIYAAYSTAMPTALVRDGRKKGIAALNFNVATAQGHAPLFVPRAMAWPLAKPDRTGLPENLVKTVLDPRKGFEDIVAAFCDYHAIALSYTHDARTFSQMVLQGHGDTREPVTVQDYLEHIATLWFDLRVDPKRLESRMAGSAPWKLKSLAVLLQIGLTDDSALSDIEKMLHKTGITAEDILEARKNVPFQGLMTPMGKETAGSVLRKAMKIVENHAPKKFHGELAPLKTVLRYGSDAEILASLPILGESLTATPFNKREPLAVNREAYAFRPGRSVERPCITGV